MAGAQPGKVLGHHEAKGKLELVTIKMLEANYYVLHVCVCLSQIHMWIPLPYLEMGIFEGN